MSALARTHDEEVMGMAVEDPAADLLQNWQHTTAPAQLLSIYCADLQHIIH